MLHPASLLVFWIGFAVALQWLPLHPLMLLTAFSLLTSALFAPQRTRNLIWRSRWLLLSLGILFIFFTPGEFLPDPVGRLGLTYEGLARAGEHLGRLLVLLATLAVMHERLGTRGLLTGFHWLLGPFPGRNATVVRLMLVLDYVEQRHHVAWRDWLEDRGGEEGEAPLATFVLPLVPLRWPDKILLGSLLVAGLLLAIWS